MPLGAKLLCCFRSSGSNEEKDDEDKPDEFPRVDMFARSLLLAMAQPKEVDPFGYMEDGEEDDDNSSFGYAENGEEDDDNSANFDEDELPVVHRRSSRMSIRESLRDGDTIPVKRRPWASLIDGAPGVNSEPSSSKSSSEYAVWEENENRQQFSSIKQFGIRLVMDGQDLDMIDTMSTECPDTASPAGTTPVDMYGNGDDENSHLWATTKIISDSDAHRARIVQL